MAVDAWDHSFAEARHIATVHAKYGEHHLEKQLAAEEKDTEGKTQNTSKGIDPVPAHYESKIEFNLWGATITTVQHAPYIHQKLPCALYAISLPPPEL